MFNKDLFSNILKKINDEYPSMTEFAKAASLDRSYISKYINKKLNNPPTPKILSGITNASKSLTTYDELMAVCGYIKLNGLYNMDLNNDEIIILNQMLLDYKDFSGQKDNKFNKFNEQKYLNKLPDESRNKILIAFRINSLDLILNKQNKDINNDEFEFVSEDDAMYPLLDIGDIALIHKQDYIEDGATLLISMNNSYTIRKFILNEDKASYSLVAMNACYKNIDININDINTKVKILGKVIKTENRSAFK